MANPQKLKAAVEVTPLLLALVEALADVLTIVKESDTGAGAQLTLTVEADAAGAVQAVIDRVQLGAPLSADLASTLAFQLDAARGAGKLLNLDVRETGKAAEHGYDECDCDDCEDCAARETLSRKILGDANTDADDADRKIFEAAANWIDLSEHAKGEGLTGLRMVLIESPYAGDGSAQAIDANVEYARKCMIDSIGRGEAPYASHLLYPYVLADELPTERAKGIACGLAWGRLAAATVVYTDRGISKGMRIGIANAEGCGRPVEYRTLAASK